MKRSDMQVIQEQKSSIPEKKSESDTFLEDVIAEVVDPLAEILVDIYYPAPPEHLMVSEKVWRKNKKQEISDELSGSDIRKKVHQGVALIFEYVKSQLPSVEAEKVTQQWQAGTKVYFEYSSQKFREKMAKTSVKEIAEKIKANPKEPKIFDDEQEKTQEPDMEDLMKISPSTIDHFYAAGLQLFDEKRFKDASCVFTVLTILNYRRHNVWLSLGMSLENNEEYQLALQSFEMAALTEPDDPLAYIHSGECCIFKRDFNEALQYLATAEEKNRESSAVREDLAGYIANLKTKCTKG